MRCFPAELPAPVEDSIICPVSEGLRIFTILVAYLYLYHVQSSFGALLYVIIVVSSW